MTRQRTALVTGGAGAIGSAIVAALAAAGHRTIVLDRDGDLPCDLADEAAVRAAGAAVVREHGGADVLVHAAAAFDQAPLEGLDAATWRRVQAVNVEAILWLLQALAPGMRERGFGRVVAITSDTVWSPPSGDMVAYVASKAALEGLVRALARPLGADGITINAVAPGLTRTPAATAGVPAAAFVDVVARQALPRELVPADVAGLVAFLASDAAAAITGQALCADGGLVLR